MDFDRDENRNEIVAHLEEQLRLQLEEAIQSAGLSSQEVNTTGNNDVELPKFQGWLRELQSGIVSSGRVQQIRSELDEIMERRRRNLYH